VPLVASDPYFSIWSPADHLNGADTVHWTGKANRLVSLIRIDGQTFRLMGSEPANISPLTQTQVEVLPTRTIYTFAGAGVELTMTFLTPALPQDIDVLSRPVTYVTYECQSTDGKKHNVETYLDAASELVVNTPEQNVVWSQEKIRGLTTLKVGSKDQQVLRRRGDDVRIDWGYLYVSAPNNQKPEAVQGNAAAVRDAFAKSGDLSKAPALNEKERAASIGPVSAIAFELGKVGSKPVTRWLMLAYDDLYSIQYMKQNLRPNWRRNGWEAADLMKASAKENDSQVKRC
jgi:hypothetical protein